MVKTMEKTIVKTIVKTHRKRPVYDGENDGNAYINYINLNVNQTETKTQNSRSPAPRDGGEIVCAFCVQSVFSLFTFFRDEPFCVI